MRRVSCAARRGTGSADTHLVLNSAVPDPGCITWGKALLQAEPQLLYLESGGPKYKRYVVTVFPVPGQRKIASDFPLCLGALTPSLGFRVASW